jgi:endonuclease YncB( thermonuclease family)
MTNILLLIFTLLLCISVNAQFKFKYEKECGSPFGESNPTFRKGKIVKIIDANKVVFLQKQKIPFFEGQKNENKEHTVQLIGIDPNVNGEFLKEFLEKNVLNKDGEIEGDPRIGSDEPIFGVLWRAGGFGDLNRYLLKNGLADYLKPEFRPSGMLTSTCVLEQTTKEAKEAKLGIWGSDANGK